MVAISSSQKKTAFAVILLALIAVGVMISGRGGFSGLRSDVFNNPSFVCTDESLLSGEVRYSGTTATLQNLSTEKAGLQTKIQGWNSDIRKNEASIKKLEKEETAAEKKERALEIAVKKQCTPRVLATCAAKKQELQDVRQEIKKIRSSLTNEQNQNKSIRTNIQSAESNIKLLEKQILEIQNFKADYETCKKALEKEKTEVSSFDLIVPGEVFVNEPFDITVRAIKSADTVNNKYEGKIFFDTNNNPADVVLPLQENDGGSEYQFQAADNGIKVFTKGLTLKKAGTYEIVVFELRGSNGGIEKKVQIVAKEKTSPVTCTDSDNGYNYFTKGQTTLSNGVVSADFCSSANTLDEYICPTTPSESGVSQSYTCPHGCSEGACSVHIPLSVCGNSVREDQEQCDDGNTNNDDSCDNTCKNVIAPITCTNIDGICVNNPNVVFSSDSMIGSAITVSSNQRIAKITISNSSNKNITFHAGNGNLLSVQLQVVGDNTNGTNESIILKDQDGTTLDTGSITSATGLTQIDFNMSSVGVNGVVIPAFSSKNFYIFMDTSDLEDNGDTVQAWFDNEAADVTFGINGSGAFAVGNIIFPNKIYGPIISRSF